MNAYAPAEDLVMSHILCNVTLWVLQKYPLELEARDPYQ